jgi:filamentous hemagglutinin family protein
MLEDDMKTIKQRRTGLTLDQSTVSDPLLTQRFSAQGWLRYCIHMSHVTLGLFVVFPAQVYAMPAFGSAAWFAQAGAATAAAVQASPNATSANVPGTVNTPQQALQQTQRTMGDMGRTLQAIIAAQGVQSAAKQLSIANPNQTPNGLTVGGLQVSTAVNSDPGQWLNANLPTQQVKDGKTNVEILQTGQKAILNWNTFNVGTQTVVHFDQQAGLQVNGANEWIVLNRITDPSGVPSQIFGQIKAEGSVYLLNANGILFGGSSQVNTHSFLASSLDLIDKDVSKSNQGFLTQGLPKDGTHPLLLNGASYDDPFSPKRVLLTARGAIQIEQGASINTGDGGFDLIVAPKVTNAGTVNATRGQIILAAGAELINPGNSDPAKNNELQAKIGDNGGALVNSGLIQNSEGNITLLGKNISQQGVVGTTTGITRTGSLDIHAEEHRFGATYPNQAGLLEFGPDSVTTILPSSTRETTTSSPEASSAVKVGQLNFSGGSVLFQNAAQVLAPGANVAVNAYFSKHDFTSTSNNTVQKSSDLTPNLDFVEGRIWLAPNATLNVAGLADVTASVADTLLQLPRLGLNELADSPLLRGSFLYGNSNVVVDTTLTGTRSDGLNWQGSPLLNIKGYITQIPQTIKQLLINGGTISLVGNELITQKGAQLNLDGGYLHFQAGTAPTTSKLLGVDGQIYDIGSADPSVDYVGFAGQETVTHARWGQQESFVNPLLAGQLATYHPTYIQGGNAGSLNLFFANAAVLDGTVSAHAYAGLNQVLTATQPQGGKLTINDVNLAGVQINKTSEDLNPITPSLSLNSALNDLLTQFPDFNPVKDLYQGTTLASDTGKSHVTTTLNPNDPLNPNFWTQLSTDHLLHSGWSSVALNAPEGRVVLNPQSTLSVQPGGTIAIKAAQIDIEGTLNAVSGTINLTTVKPPSGNYAARVGTIFIPTEADRNEPPQRADLIVGTGAVLNTRGQWVNDNALSAEQLTGQQYINGGTINLTTTASSNLLNVPVLGEPANLVDTTGSIILKTGSLLDVSSGGYITPLGQLQSQNAIPQGKAGGIALKIYDLWFGEPNSGSSRPDRPNDLPIHGRIQLDGTLHSVGFSGGGTLTLQALGIQIGGQDPNAAQLSAALPSATPSVTKGYQTLWLQPDFFAQQGFGNYILQSMYDTTLKSDTTLHVSQLNYLPNVSGLLQAPTGSDLTAGQLTAVGRLDDYHRTATSLTLGAGLLHSANAQYQTGANPDQQTDLRTALTLEKNSAIITDAGANVTLASTDQMDVEGTIQAAGGRIRLYGDTADLGYLNNPIKGLGGGFGAPDKGIWLGAQSVLDVSGVTLLDPFATSVSIGGVLSQPRSGKILAGGSVVISNDMGYIAALPGAQIRASGTNATFDLAQSSIGLDRIQPTAVWSDAGSVTLAAGKGLYFDGQITAQGGSSNARGGSLNLTALNSVHNDNGFSTIVPAKALVLSQSGEFTTAAGLTPLSQTPQAPDQVLYFAADRLLGSGISHLNINADPALPATSVVSVPLYFNGSVNLNLADSLILSAPQFIAVTSADRAASPTGLVNPSALTTGMHITGESQANLQAAYVNLSGTARTQAVPVAPVAAQGDATLNISANFIDLQGSFNLAHFKEINLNSQGDIRLLQNIPTAGASQSGVGSLYTPGNVTLTAAQIYPASGNAFIVLANADLTHPDPSSVATDPSNPPLETMIRIQGNGLSASQPLSAGGMVLLDANRIEQAGVLRAPAGQLILGVNHPEVAATQAQFGHLPLTITHQLDVLPNSITSVSLGSVNTIVPYGQTEDGKTWQYATNGSENINIAAPPQKQVTFSASSINLNQGALIDLSGGGNLQAIEWVPGTGGSRDLLSQNNVSYVTDAQNHKTATAVPLYPDQRGVYAILPGYSSPVAAYDPLFAIGQAPIGVGQQVYLSASNGLPAGYYTLLPAKYATLPGAYRIVAQTDRGSLSSQNIQTPDGTQLVAGYWADGLTGAHDALSTTFALQSRQVWGQYSEYTSTLSDAFFGAQASHAGTPSPLLMRDAGQLILGATKSLQLGAKLDTTAQAGGSKAQVDISADAIQIVGGGAPALDHYLQLNANDLTQLNAGSLMIGGTRQQVAGGTQITTQANSIVVSNDGSSPLAAPEIMLVTRPDASTPTSANGLKIDAGSVISATGDLAATSAKPLIFGVVASTGNAGVSGDGAMLRVSNAGNALISRVNLPHDAQGVSTAQGLITIGSGVVLSGGKSLTLDTTHNALVDGSAVLSGQSIALNSGKIAVTNDASLGANYDGLVVGPNSLQKFANADQLILSSYSTMDFLGTVDLTFGKALNLSAGTFNGAGTAVHINADHLTLENTLNAPGINPLAAGAEGAELTLTTRSLTLGQGNKQLNGFSRVSMSATDAVDVAGTGRFDLGSVPVSIKAPLIVADQGADNTLQTTGAMTLQSSGTIPAVVDATRPLGGKVTLVGGSIDSNMQVRAHSGQINLRASQGDLNLTSGSVLDVAGTSQAFFDVNAYAPAGAISLNADQGNLQLASGTTLDISAAQGGGDAGQLTVGATQQITLAGTLKGNAQHGQGGSLTLNSGSVVDLNGLSQQLATSGINQSITISSHQGNLTLAADQKLVAQQVSLTADGGQGNHASGADQVNGNVVIEGVIDASTQTVGSAGGKIRLSGKSSVQVDGQLLASSTDLTQRGGTVTLNTSGNPNGTLNSDYGYQNVDRSDSGLIHLGSQALIDVSGGTQGGLSGGTLSLRAPLLSDGDVQIDIAPTAQIKGARDVALNAYAVWSTTDASSKAKQHFDGIVDPAGWYDSNGHLLAGKFTDSNGVAKGSSAGLSAAQIKDYLSRYTFTPDHPNRDHQTFYGNLNGDNKAAIAGTLMGFVQHPKFSFEPRFTAIENFHARPEIDLVNPDQSINGGNISVLTPWNLGAGQLEGGVVKLDYRYQDQAPVLSLRAAQNIDVNASLSDGFFQFTNLAGGAKLVESTLGNAKNSVINAEKLINAEGAPYQFDIDFSGVVKPATFSATDDSALVGQYYAAYEQYTQLYSKQFNQLQGGTDSNFSPYFVIYGFSVLAGSTNKPFKGPAPALPLTLADYPTYLVNWQKYFNDFMKSWDGNEVPVLQKLAAPPTVLVALTPPTDNTPSPISVQTIPLPMASATLLGGESSSYRLIAGADVSSSDPLSLLPSSATRPATASITVDGHSEYTRTDVKRTILFPTMIRTGVGSIDLVAAQDLRLQDAVAPGVVYTAGQPSNGTTAAPTAQFQTLSVLDHPTGALVVTGTVNPDAAGDIRINVGHDILSSQHNVDSTGRVTGTAGAFLAQNWWQWMQTGNPLYQVTEGLNIANGSSINFANFSQGIMNVGGNVDIHAGRDIRELSVSLPTTWYFNAADHQSITTVGGGTLNLVAGRDILSGNYFVAQGVGNIHAGGAITTSDQLPINGSVSTVLALQDAVLNVSAQQTINIGHVFNPSYLFSFGSSGSAIPFDAFSALDMQTYSSRSALNLTAVAGDIRFNTLQRSGQFYGANQPIESGDNVLPASLRMTALMGGVNVEGGGLLFPSSKGALELMAQQSINLISANVMNDDGSVPNRQFGLSDYVDTTSLAPIPSPLGQLNNASDVANAQKIRNFPANSNPFNSGSTLHAGDSSPVRVYSLTGSIVNGAPLSDSSTWAQQMDFLSPKLAQIYAGQDIVNLLFHGQNLQSADSTRIVAGHDIVDHTLATDPNSVLFPALVLGGVGTFEVSAGRDIGPLTNPVTLRKQGYGESSITTSDFGILTTGNRDNQALPLDGANLNIKFGIAPGLNTQAFISSYIAPSAQAEGIPSFSPDLVQFMQEYQIGLKPNTGLVRDRVIAPMTPEQAWTLFQALTPSKQQLFVDQVFSKILTLTATDYNNSASPYYHKYARGYSAINTLYPAKLGYTANNLLGGSLGATTLVNTGDLDMRNTTLQTQQGGNISIAAPGGTLLVGSSSAPPADTPSSSGIIAARQGDINIFSDNSVLLAQSRIFTEQGGDLLMWSANGDINAGKGAKTSSELAHVSYVCSIDYYCRADALNQVSGAGIAVLQTLVDGKQGNAYLVAPRGTIDAGDAGIRVAGNFFIAAQKVANADNIQVKGASAGVPSAARVDTGALSAASNAAAAAAQQSGAMGGASSARSDTLISVEIVGFGDQSAPDCKGDNHPRSCDTPKQGH